MDINTGCYHLDPQEKREQKCVITRAKILDIAIKYAGFCVFLLDEIADSV